MFICKKNITLLLSSNIYVSNIYSADFFNYFGEMINNAKEKNNNPDEKFDFNNIVDFFKEGKINDNAIELINNHCFNHTLENKEIAHATCKETGIHYIFQEKIKDEKADGIDENKNKDDLIIMFHGITDNIEKFKSVQDCMAKTFYTDTISFEYNSYFGEGKENISSIDKTSEMSNKIYEALKKFLESHNKYKNIIIFGYSHGNKYAIDLLKLLLNKKEIEINIKSYLGCKGYKNIYSSLVHLIKTEINVENNGIDLFSKLIFGEKFNIIKKENNNIETLKSIKKNIDIKAGNKLPCDKKLKNKHAITDEDISEIYKIYNGSDLNKEGKVSCLFFYTENDNVVGDAFKEINLDKEEPKDKEKDLKNMSDEDKRKIEEFIKKFKKEREKGKDNEKEDINNFPPQDEIQKTKNGDKSGNSLCCLIF